MYFNSPLSPIKDVRKILLHFSQLTQQREYCCPQISDRVSSISGHLEEAKVKEKPWLEHGIRLLLKDELEKEMQ